MPAALAGATAFGAISSTIGGFSAMNAANTEAGLQKQQGALALSEAQSNAQNTAFNLTQEVGRQQISFLANGVSLEGSPSAVVKSSTAYGQQQVQSILNEGAAQDKLAIAQASQTQNQGRAALIAGISQGIGSAATGASNLYKAGAFNSWSFVGPANQSNASVNVAPYTSKYNF